MEITEFFGSTINCVYSLLLGLGFLYSLLLLLGHGGSDLFGDFLGDIGIDLDVDMDVDMDVDLDGVAGHDVADFFHISTLALASGITAIGAVGIITRALGFSEIGSVFAAAFGGLVIGGFAQAFFVYILKPTTDSSYRISDLVGSAAEVTTSIPENNVGQIALVASGARVTLGARTTDGSPVECGATVKIQKVVGGVAYVLPELGPPWV